MVPISIVDYGAVNLGSIQNMLRKLGMSTVLASSPDAIARAEKILLPGVGAFDYGMAALSELGLVEPLRQKILDEGAPILGICLGMQILKGAVPVCLTFFRAFPYADDVEFDSLILQSCGDSSPAVRH